MLVKILGLQPIDFVPENQSTPIKGIKLHYSYASDNTNNLGRLTDTIFLREGSPVKMPATINFGSDYRFVYDFNGKRAFLSEIVAVDDDD